MGELKVELGICSYSQCIDHSPSTDVNEILVLVRILSGILKEFLLPEILIFLFPQNKTKYL